jgi:capsular polysaccharide biosynthesis protein
MNNNTFKKEIDLKDFMFAVFRKWRIIMLVAFTLAILLGGYKCGKELIHQRDDTFVSDLRDQYVSDLKKYEQSKKGYERDINNFTSSITYQEKYKENSLLLKTDPYNKGVASVDVFVKMSKPLQENNLTVTTLDLADGVVKAYASAIQQGGFLADMAEQKGIDLIYLKELIEVAVDYDSNMFNVTVTCVDEKGAEEILNKVIDNVEALKPDVQESLGQHSISLLNRNAGVVTDQLLADYQQQKVNNLAATNINLEDAEKALKNLEEPQMPVALSKISILKAGIKYGVLGWFAGVFLTTFGVCVAFIMNMKLSADNDLKDLFGLKLLGRFSQMRTQRALTCIDDWLDRLEGREYIPDELAYELVAANVNNFVCEGESVFLTGIVGEENLEGLVMKLQEKLPEIKLGFGVDMTRTVSTLRRLPEYDMVILVESRGESRYRDIEREVDMIQDMKKDVIGYIILDSSKKAVRE